MIITIPTTDRKYFRQALELLKPLPPINTIRDKELDVLAEFLYHNDKYKNIESDLRSKILFDYDTKLAIREYLGISEANFNNIVTRLRKLNILNKKRTFNTYGITSEDKSITFKFKINEEV